MPVCFVPSPWRARARLSLSRESGRGSDGAPRQSRAVGRDRRDWPAAPPAGLRACRAPADEREAAFLRWRVAAPQLTANFITLIASEFTTAPPTRRVA